MDRKMFEKLMGLIFEVNSTTKNRIFYTYGTSAETIKLEIYEDNEVLSMEKVTLSLDYMLIENDYLYVVLKCQTMLEQAKKVS